MKHEAKKRKTQQEKNRYEDTRHTRNASASALREVYLAPEDDNRLQINCNYVDIVAGELGSETRWDEETPSAYCGTSIYIDSCQL